MEFICGYHVLQFAEVETAFYVLTTTLVIGFALTAFLILSRGKKADTGTSLLQLQQQIESIRRQMDASIDRTTNSINLQLEGMNKRMDETMKSSLEVLTKSNLTFSGQLKTTAETVESVKGSIGKIEESIKGSIDKLEESNKRIFEVGKDIAGLQELLRPPQIRGGLGEYFLARLLEQIMPRKNFETQYTFQTGNRVDAVIRLNDKLICIDSKFPLEDFQRMLDAEGEKEKRSHRRKFQAAVKKHIDDISTKYILPDEGTYEFAFMYIPVENVYYETITRDDESDEGKGVLAYAMTKHVIPVSPNSFYAYLFTVTLGLRGLEIEKNAEQVMARLRGLSTQLGRFQDEFDTLGTHIRNAAGKYDSANRQLTVLDGKITQITEIEKTSQPPAEITD